MDEKEGEPDLPKLTNTQKAETNADIRVAEYLSEVGGIESILDGLQLGEREDKAKALISILGAIYVHGYADGLNDSPAASETDD